MTSIIGDGQVGHMHADGIVHRVADRGAMGAWAPSATSGGWSGQLISTTSIAGTSLKASIGWSSQLSVATAGPVRADRLLGQLRDCNCAFGLVDDAIGVDDLAAVQHGDGIR
ncbi:MAG: hypothetical protein R3E87_19870 [Burkholderiaceae bacterium]